MPIRRRQHRFAVMGGIPAYIGNPGVQAGQVRPGLAWVGRPFRLTRQNPSIAEGNKAASCGLSAPYGHGQRQESPEPSRQDQRRQQPSRSRQAGCNRSRPGCLQTNGRLHDRQLPTFQLAGETDLFVHPHPANDGQPDPSAVQLPGAGFIGHAKTDATAFWVEAGIASVLLEQVPETGAILLPEISEPSWVHAGDAGAVFTPRGSLHRHPYVQDGSSSDIVASIRRYRFRPEPADSTWNSRGRRGRTPHGFGGKSRLRTARR